MIDKAHIASVFAMTGIIWIIQIVHYPSFFFVEPSRWKEFHDFHTLWITPIVGPLMLIQLGTSFFVSQSPTVAVGFTLAVFAATFLVSVPLHNKLALEFNSEIAKQLIQTNWIRTAIWSIHSIWCLAFLAKDLKI